MKLKKHYHNRAGLERLAHNKGITEELRERIRCALIIGTDAAYRACGEVGAGLLLPIPQALRRAFRQADATRKTH